jgi:hypothetical protein
MYSDEITEDAPIQTVPAWAGRVSNNVTAAGQDLFVRILDIDGGQKAWGPCRWSPQTDDAGNATYPSRDDDALVIKDSDGEYWVVKWWTYG